MGRELLLTAYLCNGRWTVDGDKGERARLHLLPSHLEYPCLRELPLHIQIYSVVACALEYEMEGFARFAGGREFPLLFVAERVVLLAVAVYLP